MEFNEFINIVIPLKNKMYRLARRLLKETEEAEDSVQDAFVKLWVKRDIIKNTGSLESLSMITVKNICLDKLKAKRRTNLRLVDEDIKADSTTPYRIAVGSNYKEIIDKIIGKLPEQQKMVVQLRDVEGMTNEEVAEILKVNNSAVRTALSRARKTIRESLIEEYGYEINEN